MTAQDIILPLMNMAATTLANVVVENKLDAAEEIALTTGRFEEMYEEYLRAYCQPTAR
ncbi:hypothetical protein [Sphingomonas jaspsi]|uniref:hypothetical protein n=1 Tax=Sphingomonas jaspsi TaxID=392409 RepID=UPI0004B2C53F|nr:hypothetical protein [Sphingomonas jaspsi]